jgi:transcriptional regulator with XRE-family HTH domain
MTTVAYPVDEEIDVGRRLREIRRARRLTLREVADRAELSESFLSQIERGRSGASIASLQRIAAALELAVSDLFSPDIVRPRVLRRADRSTLSFGNLARKTLLTPKPFESMEVLAVEFEPDGTTGDEAYTHGDSEELFLVVSGSVELQLGEELLQLGPGDCAHYRSSMPHRVRNLSPERAEVVFVISPPSY